MTKNNYTHETFLKSYKTLKKQHLYLIIGDEPYLKKKTMETLVDFFIETSHKEFDYTSFYGDEIKFDDILNEARLNPLLNDIRIVSVIDFDKISAGSKERLNDYLLNNNKTTILILTAENLNGKLSLVKTINKLAVTITCKKPYNTDKMQNWIIHQINLKGKTISPDALRSFVLKLEPDYYSVLNEIEKITLYSKQNHITLEDVRNCTIFMRVNSIFELQNNLGKRKKKETLTILENMLTHGEPLIMIIVMLTRFFTVLWRVNALLNKNIAHTEITQNHLKEIHPYFRKDYLSFADNYSLNSIRIVLSHLLNTDYILKSSDIKESILAYNLIMNILNS